MTFVKNKQIIFIAILALLPLCIVNAQPQTVIVIPSSEVEKIRGEFFFIHLVKPGQTLYSISRAYAVTQEAIIGENPELEYGLKSDQVIRIPAFSYTVVAGDTEFGLSRRYDISIEQLRAFNPVLSDGLKLGQELFLPLQKSAPITYGQAESVVSRPDTVRLPVWPRREIQPTDTDTSQQVHTFISDSIIAIRSRLGRDGRVIPCAEAQHRDVYNVALLIPLFLEGLPSKFVRDTVARETYSPISLRHKSFSFIPYYQGVLLALDSVRLSGVDIRLHVFDVDQNELKAREAVSSPGFRDVDLIIGPFYSSTLNYIASFAYHNNIPVVSPLLPDKQQLMGLPNLFNAVPSLELQLNSLARFIAKQYADKNIILVHNNQPQALTVINSFRNTLKNSLLESKNRQGTFAADTVNYSGNMPGVREPATASSIDIKEIIYDREGIRGLLAKMDRNDKNIVITLIGGEAFLSNYLRELNMHSDNYDIELFGIPEWVDYERIEIDYLLNLNVHLFTHDFNDYSEQHIKDFIRRYRNEFKTEPSSDAFIAANTAYYFFTALSLYGRTFPECMEQLNHLFTDTHFQFKRPFGNGHGWENSHSVLYKYKDFRKVDVSRN